MGSNGLQWDTGDTILATRMNRKTIFVGTGAEISGLGTTYAGQHAYCTTTGSGFTAGIEYQRDNANSAWISISSSLFTGDGTDGAVTISSDTDLGSSNVKRYASLTVNSSTNLTGNSPLQIAILGNLTLNGNIHVNNKGSAGGTGTDGADGGAGGGTVWVTVGGNITGTGKIQANGGAGTVSSFVNTITDGNDGTAPTVDGVSFGTAAGGAIGHGGGGGAGIVNGGAGSGGTAGTNIGSIVGMFMALNGGGGAEGGHNSDSNQDGGGGGGAGGYVQLLCYGTCSAITLEAIGGAGGNSHTSSKGGGGGGGGLIRAFFKISASITTTVTGGAGGSGGTAGTNGVAVMRLL